MGYMGNGWRLHASGLYQGRKKFSGRCNVIESLQWGSRGGKNSAVSVDHTRGGTAGGLVYSNSTVTVTLFGASAGIWDFIRYRLVTRESSSIDLYTNVPFVSLLSVS